MLFEPGSSSRRRTGDGGHFGDGRNRLTPVRHCCRRGQSPGPPIGSIGSTSLWRSKNFLPSANPLRKATHTDHSNGSNRPLHDWAWPRRSKIQVDRESTFQKSTTKKSTLSPDPFEFLLAASSVNTATTSESMQDRSSVKMPERN